MPSPLPLVRLLSLFGPSACACAFASQAPRTCSSTYRPTGSLCISANTLRKACIDGCGASAGNISAAVTFEDSRSVSVISSRAMPLPPAARLASGLVAGTWCSSFVPNVTVTRASPLPPSPSPSPSPSP
ncbi:hypothetical protein BX661DRAFT_189901 [Kickxella alabastrina]|uniref:uncharacterized protein n=1 Tax=Kickxella alabastrina TaxID=61397 RepID=UPI00221FC76D|nr:uncharacterized protein BX661DRAFT_189901 [Kickxella alabastrina]KAI7819739.1 hypothetical protein BX661DRAFT_189901 [Kickxella alabastrina]